MRLLDLYRLYDKSKGFERELYGGLYKLYGGKKIVKETTEVSEWLIRTFYKVYLAEQKYEEEKGIFYKENARIIEELKLLKKFGKYDGWKCGEYEDNFALFKKEYLWSDLLYPCFLNLKRMKRLRLDYINNGLHSNFMVTLYRNSGHMLSKVSFDFTLDDYLLFNNVIMNVIDIYMALRYDMKNNEFYVNKMSLKLYNNKLIDIFCKMNLKMIEE